MTCLLQVALHARIEEEQGHFDLNDVADGVCKKLIYRHPHVFGDVSSVGHRRGPNQLGGTQAQGEAPGDHTRRPRAVARSLPALWRAEKVQKKAKKAGFDWPERPGALDKLSEELTEVQGRRGRGQRDVEEEIGDLLFSVVNVARHCHVDPEMALHRACEKFIARFGRVEDQVLQDGKAMEDMESCRAGQAVGCNQASK